jgi:hypothetical protein
MKKLFIVLAIMALFAGMASAKLNVATPTSEPQAPSRVNEVFWSDDMESGVNGWTTVDFTVGAQPRFHWDSYMAFQGQGQSWWCGTFEYDLDGGYGNIWDEKLAIPTTDLSTATAPILTYAFRHDSESGYDYTYVQVESLGVFKNLNRGYDGRAPWSDIGLYGFELEDYDNPLNARFRFISDGGWSDEDGDYLSVGGAFACDNVQVFDYWTGFVYFFDSEPGAREDECIPVVPGAAGDYWHLIDRACPATSDPHSWWCGDDADTSLVPPGLNNGLLTPVVPVSAMSCTAHFYMHFACPTLEDDFINYAVTTNGVDYYDIGGWWGDFGSCDGWGSTGVNIGFDVGQFTTPPFFSAGFMFTMVSSDDGCGPGLGGDAGFMIDDFWFEGVPHIPVPVEETSWGSVKSMFR